MLTILTICVFLLVIDRTIQLTKAIVRAKKTNTEALGDVRFEQVTIAQYAPPTQAPFRAHEF